MPRLSLHRVRGVEGSFRCRTTGPRLVAKGVLFPQAPVLGRREGLEDPGFLDPGILVR